MIFKIVNLKIALHPNSFRDLKTPKSCETIELIQFVTIFKGL